MSIDYSDALNYLIEPESSVTWLNYTAIQDDLVDRVVYDDPAVFRRLRVDQVDDDIVVTCAASFKAANEDDIELLKDLFEEASEKTPESSELEESDMADDLDNHEYTQEMEMHDPLVRLFTYIANFGQGTAPRKFLKSKRMLHPNEAHTFGFASCRPDLNLVPGGVVVSKSKTWRDRDAFGHIALSDKEGPKPATSGIISPIVIQSADYARLLMSARPFMLFCVGIQIFGSKFSIGIFDRNGVTFSPAYDMFDDVETLIRVVRTLTCNLSIKQLGFDPTVRILSDDETQRLAGPTTYPSAVISSCGRDPGQRQWCTIGPPIWISPSLMGRGTCIWRVREYVEGVGQQWSFLQGIEMIMKTAWRSSDRTSESDIYLSITSPPPGLAEFECGGDVQFAGFPVTVQNLRTYPKYKALPEGEDNLDPPTLVLHRLVLRTVGRPLWDYTSDRDLLMGFRDAIEAHKALCDQGILHRDINAGNVMLTQTLNGPLRGFITDVEFAHIEDPNPRVTIATTAITTTVNDTSKNRDQGRVRSGTKAVARAHTKLETTAQVQRNAVITGTAQFMAREILMTPAGRVMYEPKHDVESFIWVLSYSVMRNLCLRASKGSAPKEAQAQYAELRYIFHLTFGHATNRIIASARQSGSDGLMFPIDPGVSAIVASFMSNALVALFEGLRVLVYKACAPEDPIALSHDVLLKAVDNALAGLP